MKKIFTFLGLFFVASASFGQQLISVLNERMYEGAMLHYSADTYAYYPDGLLKTKTTDLFSISGEDNYSRETYTYDANGNVLTKVYAQLDLALQDWTDAHREVYVHDASNKELSRTVQVWTGSDWLNSSRTENTYDGSGFLVNIQTDFWNAGAWQDHSKMENVNDAQGKVTQAILSDWENNTWEEKYRLTYTYAASGGTETILTEDKISGSWVNSSKNNFVYDGNFSNEMIIQYWIQNSWKDNDKFISEYGGDETLDVFTWQYWHEGQQQWKDSSQSTYTYMYVVTGVEEQMLAFASVYPNPANDVVFVDFGKEASADIRVLDLSGKTVKSIHTSGMLHEVSLAGIAAGTYLLAAEANGKKEMIRIVKQ